MSTIHAVQEFWNRRPCNVNHSNHELGSKAYFDEVEARKFRAEPHLIDFSDFAAWKDLSVLEIGCGIGTAAVNFARAGAHYTGVELSKQSLDLARRRFEIYGLEGDFYLGNAENLDEFLPMRKYDLVYSWGVVHHTVRPEKIIRNVKQYLNRDGVFKIMVYASNSWKNFMIQAGLDQPEAQYGCPIAHTYSKDGLLELLGHGFDVMEIYQDHIFPYEIESYKNRQYVRHPWFESMPQNMFDVLQKNLGWHLMATARWQGSQS